MDMAVTVCKWMFRILWNILKKVGVFFLFKLGGYWFIICSFLLQPLMAWQMSTENVFVNILCNILSVIVVLVCMAMFVYNVIRYFKRRKDPTWGILANRKNGSVSKKENKILDPDIPEQLQHDEKIGVFFGEKDGKYVCQPENMDGHVMILGGPGSMKSTSVILQTMRSWGAKDTNEPGSWKHTMFVIDIKKELEHIGLTDEQKARTKIFNPEKEFETCGFDPFYLCKQRTRPDEIYQDMQDIAFALIPHNPKAKDPYWDTSARNILTGVLLYGFRVKKLGFIDTLEWMADHTSIEVIDEICSCSDADCRRQVLEFKTTPEQTLGSIWSTMMNPVKLFTMDSMVKNALRKDGPDGMSPQDLEEGWNIICQIPEPKLEQWSKLLILLVNQALKFFEMRDEQTRDLRNESILFMLDETPRLGRLKLECLSTLRSKGIHIVLCGQSIPQYREIYGNDFTNSILNNTSLKVILSATDADSQRLLSTLGGKFDKTMISRSTNQRDLDPFGGSGTSYSEQLRDILPPETFGNLPNTGQLILFNNLGESTFCRVNKIPWFADKTWVRNEATKAS